MPHVKLDKSSQNLDLYYEIHGSGKNKVLFIMGLLTDGSAWYRQTDFFLKHPDYQCVSYDNRGFGRSSAPLTFHYSTTQMAKDALGLVNHLQWSQCHVVGTSMGGMIALELALIAPEKILSLSLLCTHAGGLTGRAPFIGVRHIIRAISARNETSSVENSLDMLYSLKTLADTEKRKTLYHYHLLRYRKRLPASIIGLIGQLTTVYRHYVSYADLLRIRYASYPCLIMVGTEDRLVREANSYLIQRVLGCRLVKLDDAGHGILGESSDVINQELLNLFESSYHKKLIPKEYSTEIKALEYCCQHRTHCFIHDFVGFLKGLFFALILSKLLTIATLTKNFHLTLESVILLACLNGLRRSVICVYNTYNARKFIQKHRLQLNRATHHGGIGINLPDEPKNGIPYGCGFDYPVLPMIFSAILITTIFSISFFM